MAKNCLKCDEVWTFEDYVCPCCGSSAIDAFSRKWATVRYIFKDEQGSLVNAFSPECAMYDVVRISTGSSVFDEGENYTNDVYRKWG